MKKQKTKTTTNPVINSFFNGSPRVRTPGIGSLKTNRRIVKAITSALGDLGIKYDSPGARGTCIAHVVIDSLKIVFYISKNNDTEKRASWEEEGYKYVWLRDDSFDYAIQAGTLKNELREAFEAMKSV